MRAENELILGFTTPENRKAETVLVRLLPYFVPDNLVLVGGLAIRHHLIRHGISCPKRPFNDLDVMIKDPSEMKASISDEFLIYHYHPLRNGSFYFVLVDPHTRGKIDVFDYDPPPAQPEVVQVAGYSLHIRGVEDQFTKTLFDLMRITARHRTDPKQFSDARQLMEIADLEKAQRLWVERYSDMYPFSIEEAISKAEEGRIKYPDRVFEHPYRRSEPYVCSDCEEVSSFPITPMDRIYNILGYVD